MLGDLILERSGHILPYTRLHPTGAERAIRARIASDGAITFAEFMDLALYHPQGYYAQRQPLGAGGDYFTSPIVHPAFGAAIAHQLRIMWQTLGQPSRFLVVEAGAGDGVLARDITAYCSDQLGAFAHALHYVCIDREIPVSRHRQNGRTFWLRGSGMPLSGIVGCVLSNELLDAFAVHRFRMVDGQPREIYVANAEDGRFVEQLGEPSAPIITERIAGLDYRLPDGFEGEVNAGIGPWVREVAASLKSAYVLTIDYGHESDQLFSSIRSRGTLQTYYKHIDGSSPYQRIGRQDMTAHVDFTSVIREGRAVGLRPVFLSTQAEFLTSLGLTEMEADVRTSGLHAVTRRANLRSIRALTAPDGLGSFKVLVQEKDTGIRRAGALLPQDGSLAGVRSPLLTEGHLHRPSQDAPDTGLGLQELWPPR